MVQALIHEFKPKKLGLLRTVFSTSWYCYPEVEYIFVNISAKTKLFSKILRGVDLGPTYYFLCKKPELKNLKLCSVPLTLLVFLAILCNDLFCPFYLCHTLSSLWKDDLVNCSCKGAVGLPQKVLTKNYIEEIDFQEPFFCCRQLAILRILLYGPGHPSV